jgi:phenylalanyl-tRNA synthetase alpha chain
MAISTSLSASASASASVTTPASGPALAVLSAEEVRRALSIRDLTDPAAGPHALQLMVEAAATALAGDWGALLRRCRRSPIVSVADNYDRLHYPSGGAARDARYTRYLCETALLRTQTSALVPPALRELAAEPAPPADVLLVCPGLVYRRDCIDRLHTGEPHQLDLWRVRRGPPLASGDLAAMIARVVAVLLPGRAHRVTPAEHPYTSEGLQIDVQQAGEWIEIGECGLALPALLVESGLDPAKVSGLAMGLGLDRLLMLRKGLPDIRLLRAEDPRIAGQLLDLAPWRPVSSMPPVRRDLSLALDGTPVPEELGHAVRVALGDEAALVESVELLDVTPAERLPDVARQRLGIGPGQVNALLRVVLRALDRTLTDAACNDLRDRIYAALHRGSRWTWASADRREGEGKGGG